MTSRPDDNRGSRRDIDSDDRVVLFVDGGLEGEALRSFERDLAGSEALRGRVKRAGLVRDLVRSLPRVVPTGLPSATEFLERIEVDESTHVVALLDALPRRSAPAAQDRRFLEFVAREADADRAARSGHAGRSPLRLASEHGAGELDAVRHTRRPTRRPTRRQELATWAAAAALLMVTTLLYTGSPAPRPSGSKIAGISYRFEVVRGRPGRPVEAGAERGLHHVPGLPAAPRRGMGGRK